MTFCLLFIIIAAEREQMSAAEWPASLVADTVSAYGQRLRP